MQRASIKYHQRVANCFRPTPQIHPNSALNILPGLLSFPNYKALMKLHKIPSAARFIVAARTVVTTPAAILLCKFTKAVDPFLVSLLKENFAQVPDFPWHTHSTILKNSANMVQVVTAINHRGLVDTVSFQAGDVARLYTNIPLAALKIRLKALYKRLFDSRGAALKVFLNRRRQGTTGIWLPSSEVPPRGDAREGGARYIDKFRIFTFEDVCELIDFVVDNNYVSFGQRLYRQILGISMGGNASVYIANHYLFSYELEFYERLVNDIVAYPIPNTSTGPTRLNDLPLEESSQRQTRSGGLIGHRGAVARFLLEQFLYIFRYIDDISSVNNPYLAKLLYTNNIFYGFMGIYPPELCITLTDPTPSLNYLDITISSINSDNKTPLHTSYYNKFSEQAFRHLSVIRFTHASSNISSRIKRNLLTGAFHRYRYNLSNQFSFIDSVAAAFVALVRSGYSEAALNTQVYRLCRDYDGLFGYGYSYLAGRILVKARFLMENSS